MTFYIIFSIIMFLIGCETTHFLFCFLLWFYISVIYLPCLGKTNYEQIKKEVKQQEEYDNEWGIIDYRKKD